MLAGAFGSHLRTITDLYIILPGSFVVKQICPSNTAFSCFIHRFCKKCHSCPQWKSVFRHFIQIRAAFIRTPVRSLSVRVQEPSVLPHSGHRHLKSTASPVRQTLPLPPISVLLRYSATNNARPHIPSPGTCMYPHLS